MALSKDQRNRIEDCIEFRFFSCLRMSWILDWLCNFDEEDRDAAISILEHIDYYRVEDISTILMKGIDELLKLNKNLHFIAVGEPGKSGGHILYYIQNIFKFRPYSSKKGQYNLYRSVKEIDLSTLTVQDEVVFVDDIVGSGKTQLTELTNANVSDAAAYGLSIMTVVYNEKGESLLKNKFNNIKIYGEKKLDAFDLKQRLLGTRSRTKEIREICYEYGEKIDKNHPLGYNNSQMLVVFAHAVPNNTLPIIWKEIPTKWKALIPRSHFLRNERALNNRKDNNRWLKGLKNILGEDPAYPHTLYGTNRYALLYVIRSLHTGKVPTVIANEMGITTAEYDDILKEGISKGLIDDSGELTSIAKSELDQLAKKLKYSNTEKYINKYDSEMDLFVPETFRGLK